MIEKELVEFLTKNLKLEIKEEASPYQAPTHRRFVFRLSLATGKETITLSEQSLSLHEGR